MFTTNSGRFISYYGRAHTLDIQRQDRNTSTISTIDQLFNVLLNVWCKETACIFHLSSASFPEIQST